MFRWPPQGLAQGSGQPTSPWGSGAWLPLSRGGFSEGSPSPAKNQIHHPGVMPEYEAELTAPFRLSTSPSYQGHFYPSPEGSTAARFFPCGGILWLIYEVPL